MFPATSASFAVRTPPSEMAACNSAVVFLPRTKLTLVSPAEMVASVAMATPSRYNVATPPVASPATMVAVAVRSVLVAESLFAVVTPPTPIADKELGATGAMVSTTMAAFAPNEPLDPGATTVTFAALPAASFIVPPFNTSAAADCTSRSLLASPACATYLNVATAPVLLTKVAVLSTAPVSSNKVGTPPPVSTAIVSSKVTVTLTVAPTL